MKRLEGKVALITGAGKGIGYGLAKAFANEGCNLVITGRTESRLLEAQKNLEEQYHVQVLPIVADGADEEAIAGVVANEGSERNSGAKTIEIRNITAVVRAVRPVFPPTATPALDST